MIRSRTYIAIPPGETVKEQLALHEMSCRELAARMGLPEADIANLLEGRVPLTSDLATRLEEIFGVPAAFWENLEAGYNETLIKVAEENHVLQRTRRNIAARGKCFVAATQDGTLFSRF